MEPKKILSSAIVGTSAMTLFSYIVSEIEKENFREPEVLAKLVKKLPVDLDKTERLIAGWIGHYGIGAVFTAFYDQLWGRKVIKPGIGSGLLFGVLGGLAGVIIWKVTFMIHPRPPAKDLEDYFKHLLLAHLVFGAFSALGYNLVDGDEE